MGICRCRSPIYWYSNLKCIILHTHRRQSKVTQKIFRNIVSYWDRADCGNQAQGSVRQMCWQISCLQVTTSFYYTLLSIFLLLFFPYLHCLFLLPGLSLSISPVITNSLEWSFPLAKPQVNVSASVCIPQKNLSSFYSSSLAMNQLLSPKQNLDFLSRLLAPGPLPVCSINKTTVSFLHFVLYSSLMLFY